jgi:ParB family transcriptional regulator, chromosome partitioning protein
MKRIILLPQLTVAEGNPRQDFSHIPGLAASIVANGQLEPVTIIPADADGLFFEITHGECRYRAVQYANEHGADIKWMMCDLQENGLLGDEIILQHIVRNSGKPLTLLEEAGAYVRLSEDYGWTVTSIAKGVGRTTGQVADLLLLMAASEDILAAVRAGTMSVSAAIELLKAPERARERIEQGMVDDPGKRITAGDVQKEVNGHPDIISAKKIEQYIKDANDRMYAAKAGSKEFARWEGVKFGLEVAMGIHEM